MSIEPSNISGTESKNSTQIEEVSMGIRIKPSEAIENFHQSNLQANGLPTSQEQLQLTDGGVRASLKDTYANEEKKIEMCSNSASKNADLQSRTQEHFSNRIVVKYKSQEILEERQKGVQQKRNNSSESLLFEKPVPLSEKIFLSTIDEQKASREQGLTQDDNQLSNEIADDFILKENRIIKKKNFDFLGRTKCKDQNEELDIQKLQLYYRTKTSCLISGAGRKQYYLAFLKNMKDLQTKVKNQAKASKQALSLSEVKNKLKKIAATRSKYKFREKIDFEKTIIMRTLGYESREIIQKIKENMALEVQEYDDLEDEGDKEKDEEKKEGKVIKDTDFISTEIIANWKKQKGYSVDQKVFVIIGTYTNLKNYLIEAGWVENPDTESLMFDLKWVTKKKDVDKYLLLDEQITNHYQKNHNLTSKSGIALNLRNLIWHNGIDIDTFYPRCFDLSDVQDFEDFIEEFKYTQAESVLKLFLLKMQGSDEIHDIDKYERLKLLMSCSILKRRTLNIEEKISQIVKNVNLVVMPEEWSVINSNSNHQEFLEKNPQVFSQLNEQLLLDLSEEEINSTDLLPAINKYLKLSKDYDPQYPLNIKNSWIVKPAGLSRGRGIRAFDTLDPLINYIVGKDVMWVAQKYMENPMTIHKKKFDIRQWVLVTEWNPLTIYFYGTCYIRICFEEYNPTDLHNKFAHLANNCISKHAENFEEKVNDTMMFMEDFIDYIKEKEGGNDIFTSKIQKQMIEIAINSIKSCKDSIEPRRNSLELYGYDFMVDEQYNTWLIEINSSPSMEFSTPVTTKLVKLCLEDTAKVIQEHFVIGEKKFKKDQEFGLWKNIYRESK